MGSTLLKQNHFEDLAEQYKTIIIEAGVGDLSTGVQGHVPNPVVFLTIMKKRMNRLKAFAFQIHPLSLFLCLIFLKFGFNL